MPAATRALGMILAPLDGRGADDRDQLEPLAVFRAMPGGMAVRDAQDLMA